MGSLLSVRSIMIPDPDWLPRRREGSINKNMGSKEIASRDRRWSNGKGDGDIYDLPRRMRCRCLKGSKEGSKSWKDNLRLECVLYGRERAKKRREGAEARSS